MSAILLAIGQGLGLLVAGFAAIVALNVAYQVVSFCPQSSRERSRRARAALNNNPNTLIRRGYARVLVDRRADDVFLLLQLAPRDPTRPPKVFHYVPWVGAAVSYGIDPMGFLEGCRKRVSQSRVVW